MMGYVYVNVSARLRFAPSGATGELRSRPGGPRAGGCAPPGRASQEPVVPLRPHPPPLGRDPPGVGLQPRLTYEFYEPKRRKEKRKKKGAVPGPQRLQLSPGVGRP